MTEPTRAKAGRRSRRSASQLFIAALVVFGIAASVLLLFSENVQWLRVGLVSALWAAIVGAFAMTKYRRDAAADQAKAKDLQTVYELQLAREISARREYELGVEARVRSEMQIETGEVAALRAELAHLRENLQVLFEGNLPTERVALRAEATRMQELAGRNYDSYQAAPSGLYVRGGQAPQSSTEGPSSPVAGLSTPYDEPVTAETSVLYPDVPIGDVDPATMDDDARAARGPAPRRPESRAGANGRRVPTPPRAPGPGSSANGAQAPNAPEPVAPQSVAPQSVEPEPVEVQSVEVQPVEAQVADEPAEIVGNSEPWDLPEPEPRRRRRRAEPESDAASGAHSNGRSVAEIMADLQGGSATGADQQPERRRRRRAE